MNLYANDSSGTRVIQAAVPDGRPTVRKSLEELRELLLKIEFISGRIADVVGVETDVPPEERSSSSIADGLINDISCAERSLQQLNKTCELLGIEL